MGNSIIQKIRYLFGKQAEVPATSEIKSNFRFIKTLTTASDGMLDKSMCNYLKTLDGKSTKEVADGLLYVLDKSARCGLASEFVMRVLDLEWRRLGGTVEPGNANCPWRNDHD